MADTYALALSLGAVGHVRHWRDGGRCGCGAKVLAQQLDCRAGFTCMHKACVLELSNLEGELLCARTEAVTVGCEPLEERHLIVAVQRRSHRVHLAQRALEAARRG